MCTVVFSLRGFEDFQPISVGKLAHSAQSLTKELKVVGLPRLRHGKLNPVAGPAP